MKKPYIIYALQDQLSILAMNSTLSCLIKLSCIYESFLHETVNSGRAEFCHFVHFIFCRAEYSALQLTKIILKNYL